MESEHQLPYSGELQRKALHLLALVIPLGMILLDRTAALMILTPVTVVAIGSDVLRVRSAGFARWLYGWSGSMMRPEERPPMGSRPVLNGATWVMISATLLAFIFPKDVAVAAFTTFMLADAAAAIIGRRLGRRRWGTTSRTVEGSAAFVGVGLITMVAFPDVALWTSVAAVLLGAAAEIPSGPLNDNVRVPFVMAIVIVVMRYLTAG